MIAKDAQQCCMKDNLLYRLEGKAPTKKIDPMIAKDAQQCCMKDDLLYRLEGKAPKARTLLVIPKSLQSTVLHGLHSSVFGGHMGFKRTMGRIAEHYWWRDMKASVKEYIRTCPACNARNERHNESVAPLAPEPRIAQPFARIGVDYMEEPCTPRGNRAILVVIDHATKWVEARACPDETAETAARFIFETSRTWCVGMARPGRSGRTVASALRGR